MPLHGARTDEQCRSDVPIALTLREKAEYFHLAR
jgi:hypothetical protein